MSRKKWLTTFSFAGAVAATVAIWNQKTTHAGKMLAKSLPGSEHYFLWKHGKVYYTTVGTGAPLLLLHRLGTGASSFEWRRLVPLLEEHFEVYTPDLLGFGKSEKPLLDYNVDIYTELVDEILNRVVKRPVHLVTSSQSAVIALKSACNDRNNVLSLTIISPPRLDTPRYKQTKIGKTFLKTALTSPIIGTTVYNSLTSKTSIHYRLKRKMYFNKKIVTPDVVNYYYEAAHQDGLQARRAPASFISGQFHTSITHELKHCTKPLFVIAGEQARTDLPTTLAQYRRVRANMGTKIIPNSRMLPHDEQPQQVAEAIQAFITEKTDST